MTASAKAREMAPLLKTEAAKSEAAGRLTDETIAALRGGDFFTLAIPKVLGGAEASPTEFLEVIEALSWADASTGWVTMAAGVCTGMAAGFLGEAGAREVFADKNRVPVI